MEEYGVILRDLERHKPLIQPIPLHIAFWREGLGGKPGLPPQSLPPECDSAGSGSILEIWDGFINSHTFREGYRRDDSVVPEKFYEF